ncbi:MAG: hypothetical protein Q9191_007712 [Dirinaria sp. TL-2023a]
MIEMINKWTFSDQEEKKTWSIEASKFRLPYWDWARSGIPPICSEATWSILKPNAKGNKEIFNNPLTGFTNPQKDSEGHNVPMGDKLMGKNAIPDNKEDLELPLPWSECIGVSRYGILKSQSPSQWSKGVNNWKAVNVAVENPPWYDNHTGPLKGTSFKDALSRLFTPGYFDSWETFASTKHNNPKNLKNTNFMSLEYIHNVVHNATGGTQYDDSKHDSKVNYGLGHMSDVPVASFDPIFWLHHCNVDRLCAMWQALNWEMWFSKPINDDPKPSNPLLPFHYDENKSSWTSDRCRDWRSLHYQYDDMKDMPSGRPKPEFQTALRKHIDKIYPSISATVRPAGFTLEDNTFNDYIINVVYDRYALKGRAYSILFYIGEPTKDLGAFRSDPNFVDLIYTFSSPFDSGDGSTACENCEGQQAAQILSKAQIPLTLPLISRAAPLREGYASIPGTELGLLEPDPVVKVLAAGLEWHFVELGGREVDHSEFPNTEIAVLHGQGTHPQGDEIMPRYENYVKKIVATERKPLGFGHETGPNHLIGDD